MQLGLYLDICKKYLLICYHILHLYNNFVEFHINTNWFLFIFKFNIIKQDLDKKKKNIFMVSILEEIIHL